MRRAKALLLVLLLSVLGGCTKRGSSRESNLLVDIAAHAVVAGASHAMRAEARSRHRTSRADSGPLLAVSSEQENAPTVLPRSPATDETANDGTDRGTDSPPTRPFDVAEAKDAFAKAAMLAPYCSDEPRTGPRSGHVHARIDPSGVVTNVRFEEGGFDGSPAGGCVRGLFEPVTVAPFRGKAVTVRRSFSLDAP